MKWNDKLNKKYTQISAYVIITAIIIYILSLIAKNAPVIVTDLMEKLGWLMKVVKPVILGFVVAYLLDPVVSFFERKLMKLKHFKKKSKRCRFYSVLLTIFLIMLGLATLVTILVYSVTKQIRIVNFDDIIVLFNSYVRTFEEFVIHISEALQQLDVQTKELTSMIGQISDFLVHSVTNVATSTVGSIGNISGTLTTLVFTVIIGIWFMIDGNMMSKYLGKVSYALLSEKSHERVNNFIKDADYVFSGYIRGQLMDAFVMMLLISISLSLIGVKFSVLIGVIAGIGNLVPYLGPFIAYAGTAVVCLLNGDIKELLIGFIALLIIQSVDGNFIGPKLLSKSIEVHPLLVIVSLIFGSAIGGFFGMLLAVPVGALIKLLFVRYIDNRTNKKDKEKEIRQAIDVLSTESKEQKS